MALFFLIGFYRVNEPHAGASVGFFVYVFVFTVGVRAADYFHVVRQSFGMLQLFKRQTAAPFPGWMRRADNGFFLALAALQLWTFIGGTRTGEFAFAPGPTASVLMVVAACALAGVVAGFATAVRRAPSPSAVWVPALYFLFQAGSGALAVWRTELYAASLAMHYVEYHIVIFPRLFTFTIDPASRVDRIAAWVRRHKPVFYGVLALLSLLVAQEVIWPTVSRRVRGGEDLWVLFNIFNGIFVTHYFVEAFIWKFRNPYFRDSLSPVYFPSRREGSIQ
jgi:hypothetical protein